MSEVNRLLDGLRRQQGKYRELVAAAEEQKRLVASSDVDALIALVEIKRALVGEVEALDREIAGDRRRWPEMRAGLDPGRASEVEEAVERTRELLAQLLRLEEEACAGMPATRDPAAARWRARGAYGATG